MNPEENAVTTVSKIKAGYVIITHKITVNQYGKKVINETCEFEPRLKNRHYTEATVILDYKNMKIVKARDEASFEDFERYLKHSYGEKFNRFLTAIGRVTEDKVEEPVDVANEKEQDQKTE